MFVRPFQFIGDVHQKKDFWKLAVLVKDKWVVVKDGKEHLEMVIVDSKGGDIQVVIPTEYKAMFDTILQENNTYTLSNFQVGVNDLLFKASDHKYRLKWTGGTTAVDVNAHNIPHPILKMKPLAEIISGKWRSDMLYHVIGVVQDMRYCQVHEGTGKKLQVNFTLRDLNDITLNCTLWESYAGTFIRYNNERKEQGPVIVLLKYGKVKEEGRFPLSISNTYSFTKLFINEDIPEINQFRERLPKEDLSQSQSQIVCTQSSGSQVASEADLLSEPMILPLSHIMELDQISYCVTVATVDKVNSTKFGWYYLACVKCPKIAKGDYPPYTCDSGHNTETEIVKYRLEIDVSYGATKSAFVLWDREVTQLLGISASQLHSDMIQAGITNRFEYPMIIESIAEKTFVFKVKWQPRWKSFSVVCYREGDQLVNQVISKFPIVEEIAPPLEAAEMHEISNTLESEDHTIPPEGMSGTSEYDPDNISQMTPSSNPKSSETNVDWDGLSQLTPLNNVLLAEPFNAPPPAETTPVTPKVTFVVPQPCNHDEIPPSKHSSSKRVKLIKQEKK